MESLAIADLHCDLLTFLSSKQGRDVNQLDSRCSLPQLKAGNVALQTLAIFTQTKRGSAALASKQFSLFQELLTKGFSPLKQFTIPQDGNVYILPAIENASGLCEEDEDLEIAFKRLDRYRKEAGNILYISLTWHFENRFGGGDSTTIGLKEDGKRLLEHLNGSNIAIDLSHTSDKLAHDILNTIEKSNWNILPIASHSNFRKVANQKRNLPEEIAREIAKRGGVIGLNFVKPFVGGDFLKQVNYVQKLGMIDSLCFGADFFYEGDIVPGLQYLHPLFYDEFGDASCYPRLLKRFNEVLNPSELEGIAHQNLNHFFERLYR